MRGDNTRNDQSNWSTIGASNHSIHERGDEDYYATDPIAIDKLIDNGGVILSKYILEPACGEGHLAERLKERGHIVIATDKVDRGYGDYFSDFLDSEIIFDDGDILTNPPYKYAMEFVEKALSIVGVSRSVYMLLPVRFLESKKRQDLFQTKQLHTVYVFIERLLVAKNGDFEALKKGGGSAVSYAWFRWVKGYNGDPRIKWI